MPQKIQVNDNAGVFVRFVDNSRRPSEPTPLVMSAAFAIESERGYMHQIYTVHRGDTAKYFGNKNWRTLGKSMYDLDMYLKGGRPAHVVRVGTMADSDDGLITAKGNTLAGVSVRLEYLNDKFKTHLADCNFANRTGVEVPGHASTFTVDGKTYKGFETVTVYAGANAEAVLDVFASDVFDGARVLIHDQADATDNGIYTVFNVVDLPGGDKTVSLKQEVALGGLSDGDFFKVSGGNGENNVWWINLIDDSDPINPVATFEPISEDNKKMLLDGDAVRSKVVPEAWLQGTPHSDVEEDWEDRELCRIFAKGEGAWGNKLKVVFKQRAWGKKNANNKWEPDYSLKDKALPKDRFKPGDGVRIFAVDIWEGKELVEQYEAASFNPADRNKAGTPIFITNVLAGSQRVEVVVNPNINPETDSLYVLPECKLSSDNKRIESGELPLLLFGGATVPFPQGSTMINENVDNTNTRSNLFMEGLNIIFRNWDQGSDPWFAVNAGSEIWNNTFKDRFGHPRENPKLYDRSQGLTAVVENRDKVPKAWDLDTDAFAPAVPQHSGDSPNYEIETPFVSKYYQWIESWDSDTSMDIFTSPAGWVAMILAQMDTQGNAAKVPAGPNYGVLMGVKRLSRLSDNEQRLVAVQYKWNPIKKDVFGYTLWDENTSQAIDSSLSNLHVMWAWQRVRRGIEDKLRPYLFEYNDEATVNTMVGLLRTQAEEWRLGGFVDEYNVNADDNRLGTNQIYINWNCKFKESARTIVVDVKAFRSDQSLYVSLAENPF